MLGLTALTGAAEELAIDGRVVGAEGRPLAGARVELRPIPSLLERAEAQLAGRPEPSAVAEAGADGDGGFRIAAPEAAPWRVVVRHPEHLAMACDLEPLHAPLQLPTVALPRRTERRIVTLDAEGRPLAGVRIAVRGFTSTADWTARYRWRPQTRLGVSDEGGALVVASAGDESLVMAAISRQAAPSASSVVYGNARPGDGEVRLQLEDRRVPACLVDAAGKPLAGVAVFYATAWDLALGVTGPEGRIAVPYRPGEGVPRLDLADAAGLIGRVSSTASPGETPRVLRLRPPRRVAGRVLDAASREPVAGAWLELAGGLERAGEGGRFSLRLPVEGGSFEVSAPGHLSRRLEVSARAPGDGPLELTVALTPSRSMAGRVLDAGGEPLAGADLLARPDRSPSGSLLQKRWQDRNVPARSQAGGRFRIDGLAPGVGYQLWASRPGFAPSRLRLPALVDEPMPDVELVLDAGLRASGVVLDDRRQPVAGAAISLSTPFHPTRTRSGGDGAFELGDLAAGVYTLRIQAEGFVPLTVPGVEVAAGDAAVDLDRVILDRGVTLTGRVTDGGGRGLEGAQVMANRLPTPIREMMALGAVSGPDGEFTIAGVSPTEQLHVSAWLKGYRHRQLPPLIPDPGRPLAIVLDAGVTVRGRVVDANGEGAAGIRVRISRPGSRAGASGTRTDAGGRFTFRDRAAGRAEVSAGGPAGIGRVAVELTAGEAPPELHLALSPAAAVRGRLENPRGEAVFEASIQLEPDDPTRREGWSRAEAATGADGRFTVAGLDGGRYRLLASHPDFEPLKRTIEVVAGVDLDLDLVFERRRPPAVRISGRVIGPGGAGVDGARVMLVTGRRAWSRATTVSFDGGRFELRARQPGAEKTWALLVDHPDFAPRRGGDFELADPPADQLVQLAPGGSVSGRVLGLDPARRWRLHVSATSPSLGTRYGHVTGDGAFRIDHLAAGEWTLTASLGGTGRQASERLSLGGDGDAAEVDLSFPAAYRLTGRALHDGAPWADARARLACSDPYYRGGTRTHADGRFVLLDVPTGPCELTVTDLVHRALEVSRRLELSADEELQVEVTSAVASGRVLGPELTPLAGVRIELRPLGRSLDGPPAHIVTDSGGRYELRTAAPGRWRLRIAADGFAIAEREAETVPSKADKWNMVEAGTDEEPDIVLERAVPAVVYVQDERGWIPEEVEVQIRKPGVGPSQNLKLRPDAEGRVVVPSLAPGTWHASFHAGRKSTYVEIEVPREPVVVVLEE